MKTRSIQYTFALVLILTTGVFGLSLLIGHADLTAEIFFQLRLPRTVAAFSVGACLGAAGLALQSLLRNPIAEPYTMGLSGGSSLGALTAYAFKLQPYSIWAPGLAVVGCILATLLVLTLARGKNMERARSLALFGILVSLFLSAIVVTGFTILSPEDLHLALMWMVGELNPIRNTWAYGLLPIAFIAFALLLSRHRALDALSLGETRAWSLGFNPNHERRWIITACTILTAMAVSLAGLVGFVGLVAPHMIRALTKTSRHLFLLPLSALLGACLLTTADTLGRLPSATTDIPAGSISALLGAPVLIYLLLRGGSAEVK